jgi:Rho termination factor, N-terminal domain
MATTTRQGAGQRSLRGFLADSAYATLGLSTAAVELVRSVDRVRVEAPRQARTIGREAPKRLAGAADRSVDGVRHLINQSVETTRSLPERATREFDGLARRGRDLVGAIRGSTATREAVDRARTARSRVKAAGTSMGRAAEGAVQAAERAGTIVADRTEPSEHREVRIEPAEVQVKPARAQVRTRPAKAPATRRRATRRPAAADRKQPQPRRHATEPAAAKAPQTGPYEERTVDELQERAEQLGIEGRASMTKDELITALREQR